MTHAQNARQEPGFAIDTTNHWVRLHTFEHNGSSELRVDVFDGPPPVMEEA